MRGVSVVAENSMQSITPLENREHEIRPRLLVTEADQVNGTIDVTIRRRIKKQDVTKSSEEVSSWLQRY